MCFDDDDEYSYESRTEIRNGRTYHTRDYYPRFGMSFRRRFGLGGSYYPSRYYTRPPASRYRSSAFAHPNRYSQRVGYPRGIVAGGYARGVVPGGYSQAMVPRGYVGAGYPGYSSGYGYGNGYQSGGHMAMPTNAAMRTIYNTVPNYGYTAHVYPPGATTTTTTYHVTNSSAQPYRAPNHVVRETRPAYVHGHGAQGLTREDIQMENRRIATERGAYDPRKIRPADARDDDPFWCREVNGEWHLRSYYQIENECHPGRWMMDADMGFLVFHRA